MKVALGDGNNACETDCRADCDNQSGGGHGLIKLLESHHWLHGQQCH